MEIQGQGKSRSGDGGGADDVTHDGRQAIFMDRDGTLLEEVGYLNHIDRVRYLPRSAEAVRRINETGFLAVVITNQSGVARRIFDHALVDRVHAGIGSWLAEAGARLDAIYVCPHHPEGLDPEYRRVCDCHKPKPGMLLRAAREHGIDLERSYLVGDTTTDLDAARNAGVKGILVLTGYGRGEVEHRLASREATPVFIAEDLLDAVEWILRRERAAAGEARP